MATEPAAVILLVCEVCCTATDSKMLACMLALKNTAAALAASPVWLTTLSILPGRSTYGARS